MKKTLLYIAAFVVALSIAIPSIIYAVQFSSGGLSQKNSDWGSFASFLSVFVGAGVGVANLLLVLYITKIVGDKDDKRFLNQLALEIHRELIDANETHSMEVYKPENIRALSTFYNHFSKKYNYLFDDNALNFQHLCFSQITQLLFIDDLMIDLMTTQNNSDHFELKHLTFLNAARAFTPHNFSNYNQTQLENLGFDIFRFEETNKALINFLRHFVLNKKYELKIDSTDKLKADFKSQFLKDVQLFEEITNENNLHNI